MNNFKLQLIKTMRVLFATVVVSVFFGNDAMASEGGGSCYLQGTYGDFSMAVTPPPGFYLRNDLYYYSANVGIHPVGGRVVGNANEELWLNMLKLAFVSNTKILGGVYSAAIVMPTALNVGVTGAATIAGTIDLSRKATNAAVGDLYVLPFQIKWTIKNHHITLAPGIVVPTGSYDENRMVNVGRNYWAFDPGVAYTYLNTKNGHELSLTSGVMMNTKNKATDYTTGNEFHLDWNLSQYFSKTFGIGFTGYWYQQLSSDQGVLPLGYNAANFKGKGVGMGASVVKSVHLGNKDLALIGKWISDVSSADRFKGNIFMLSLAFKL